MKHRWKEGVGIVLLAIIFSAAYLEFRAERAGKTSRGVPAPRGDAAPAGEGVGQEKAVQIAQGFMQAAGIDMEGVMEVKLVPGDPVSPPTWEVCWFRMPQHSQQREVRVDSLSGGIVGAAQFTSGGPFLGTVACK